ncbi:methyltransferase domain-containing protein [Candidatus Daviesbacteria bacterium]|nr:methyltransferase domain-containing protein [Candidatus Daviesbacteria bacterium]
MVKQTESEPSQLSRRARKLLGKAAKAGFDPSVLREITNSAINDAHSQDRGRATREDIRSHLGAELNHRIANRTDPDLSGLRSFDFTMRVPERTETFTPTEARIYIDGCDYPKTVDDLLLALEVQGRFNPDGGIRNMRVLDAMCGPGRLGREFLDLGVPSVTFHDGSEIMTTHARDQAAIYAEFGQGVDVVTSSADNIPLPDGTFDLVVCHNSIHQLASIGRLRIVMQEFLRLTVPRGHVIIADYQRATTPGFLESLEERLRYTRPEIVPLLIPSFIAAFSGDEFRSVLGSLPNIETWSVTDAKPPILTPQMQQRVAEDPVKGHLMDYSPISLRVIAQKKLA